MSIENEIFLKYTPDFQKLLQYGFHLCGKDYIYEKLFKNNEFKAIIKISSDGKLKGTVYDLENGYEYLPLKVLKQEGAFVGEVKEAYVNVLTDIRQNCFREELFVSAQGNRIANLIKEKYGDEPLFLWKDSPTTAVFKNPETSKWYGIVMYICGKKLTQYMEDWVEVINLKLDKEEIQGLLSKEGFFPAYHMNKKMWITIVLDETIRDKEIMKYIEESHSYTQKKISKKKKNT